MNYFVNLNPKMKMQVNSCFLFINNSIENQILSSFFLLRFVDIIYMDACGDSIKNKEIKK